MANVITISTKKPPGLLYHKLCPAFTNSSMNPLLFILFIYSSISQYLQYCRIFVSIVRNAQEIVNHFCELYLQWNRNIRYHYIASDEGWMSALSTKFWLGGGNELLMDSFSFCCVRTKWVDRTRRTLSDNTWGLLTVARKYLAQSARTKSWAWTS